VRIEDAPGRYIEFCKSTVPNGMSLNGMKIVVDCAQGATYHIAPHVFRELGATVSVLAAEPNGLNINAHFGSTHPEALRKQVLIESADLGIAFDGDGDRVIMVDERGELVDGDELMFIMARDYKRKGTMQGGVVGTVMSNFGFERALKEMDIPFVRAPVGDRFVMEHLKKQGWILGGESSGHIVNLSLTTTGDGIISALQILRVMMESNKSLYALRTNMTKMPQTLINVKVEQSFALAQHVEIQNAVKKAEQKLGNAGRILLRASGTEPVIRVMIEGENADEVHQLAQEVADVVASVSSSFPSPLVRD